MEVDDKLFEALKQQLLEAYVILKKRRLHHPLSVDKDPELEALEHKLATTLGRLVDMK